MTRIGLSSCHVVTLPLQWRSIASGANDGRRHPINIRELHRNETEIYR